MYRGVESLCNKMLFDLPTNEYKSKYCLFCQSYKWFHLKVYLGMTFLNAVRRRKLIAKETSIANCEVLDEKHRIAVQGIFVGIIIKAGGASLKVTDLLFSFPFCKK